MPGQYSLAEAAPVPSAPGGGRGAYRLEDATPPPLARESASDAISGFLQGIRDTFAGIPGAVTHPLNAIADTFAASKDQYRKAVAAAGPAGDNKGDLFGFAAHTLGMFPLLGPPMAEFLTDKDADAHEQARKLGQIVAIKTLVPKTAEMAAGAPQLPANIMRMADAVKAGAKAAASDVATGIAKVGAGELLAKVPGMEWPARLAMGYPGARQIAKGIGKGFTAAEEAGKPPVPVEAAPANLELLDAIAKHLDYKDYAAAIKNPDAKIIIDNLAKAGEAASAAPPMAQTAPVIPPPVQPVPAPVQAPAPPVAPPEPIQTFVPGRPLRAPLAVRPMAAIPSAAAVEPASPAAVVPMPQMAAEPVPLKAVQQPLGEGEGAMGDVRENRQIVGTNRAAFNRAKLVNEVSAWLKEKDLDPTPTNLQAAFEATGRPNYKPGSGSDTIKAIHEAVGYETPSMESLLSDSLKIQQKLNKAKANIGEMMKREGKK